MPTAPTTLVLRNKNVPFNTAKCHLKGKIFPVEKHCIKQHQYNFTPQKSVAIISKTLNTNTTTAGVGSVWFSSRAHALGL